MLINLSNHNSKHWLELQVNAASKYGEIIDIPFPHVDPNGDETYVERLAEEYSDLVLKFIGKADQQNSAVHIMGEMTTTFAIVSKLKSQGITCIASTSTHNPESKVPQFNFIRFREY